MLASLLLPSLLLLGPGFQDSADEVRADKLLREAEFATDKERYEVAVKKYRLIARRYPDTEAGKVAKFRSQPTTCLGWQPILKNGPSANRVDIAVMGDGYTLEHQGAFTEVAKDVPGLFARQATFKEYESYFNFYRLVLVSADDNVTGFGREEDTALGGYVLGTDAGHVGVNRGLVHEMLAHGPENDGLSIVYVRTGILGTGSPGVAAIGGRDASTTVHEWGHAFAILGDEYSTHTHQRGGVPTSPNVSPTDDPAEIPWKHWLDAKAKGIGIYEGAAGRVRDAWKPTASGCVMLSGEFFCPPCREALVLRIYSLVDPIETTNHPPYPRDHAASLEIEDEFTFEVTVMKPRSHALEVRWWILPEAETPRDPSGYDARYAASVSVAGDRRKRGKLWPIEAKPAKFSHVIKTGKHEFTVKRTDLEPGRYRLVCRARDATKFRGKKLPWVLKDEFGLLESERAWWITIPEK